MKRITKLICALLAVTFVALALCSCEKKPGLYKWYGARVNDEFLLKLTLDVGDGEKVYNVPLDTYRNLFVYYKTLVSDTVVGNDKIPLLTTDQQKTVALKEYTEDELCNYYALLALAEKYGKGLTEADETLYESDYNARIENYADRLDDVYADDFKGTKEEYAKYLYEKAIEDLGLTEEYLEYMYYKDLLDKRVKQALVPDLASFVSQSYYHFKQIYLEYTKGDGEAENAADTAIKEAYAQLESGADFDELAEKYSNNVVYGSEMYFDSYGNIVNSKDNSTVGTVTGDAVKALSVGEYSGIMMGDADDETAYFAIVMREDFDESFVYGSSDEAKQMFQYSYVGAEAYSVYYTVYNDLLEAYEQNMRIEPYDKNTYKLVKVNTLY